MQQAIEQGGDGGGVAEQLAPVIDGSVGRQQRRGPFVAPHDDLEQVLGGRVRELSHPEVVDDEQRDGRQVGEEGLAGAVQGGVGQVFEQGVGLAIQHAMPLQNRRAAQRLREVALAGAGRPEQQDVLALGDEAAGRELVDERAVHVLVEIEIEGVERAVGVAEAGLARVTSLRLFLEKEYGPWVRAHRKTGDETVARLESVFSSFLALPLAGITRGLIERWRTERLEDGTKPATVNRDLAALRSALSRAVDFGLLKDHPLGRLKAVKVDTRGIIRYLAPDEEKRLRAALKARDDGRRAMRTRLNEWRESRGYPTLPPHGTYTDHLTPLVLLALNTGLRRGELFGLRWSGVDLDGRRVVVHGEGTKTGQTRIVPINSEAVAVLSAWRPAEVSSAALVFPGRKGEPLTDIKTAWLKLMKRAEIDGFRFHDLRHTFASKLVMASVDLNTVRDLLGHSDLKMTLRYAHLAPEVKASAVEKLVGSGA